VIHQIRAMYDQGQGASIRQIAAHLKISCNTVRKYLREELSAIEGEREAGRRKLLGHPNHRHTGAALGR
jgi:transposase